MGRWGAVGERPWTAGRRLCRADGWTAAWVYREGAGWAGGPSTSPQTGAGQEESELEQEGTGAQSWGPPATHLSPNT